MKLDIMKKASRAFGRAGLQIKKHSPEILMGVGIVGVVTSTVMACKATTKIDTILNETKEQTTAIRTGMENGNVNGKEYTQEDGKKDLTIVYTQAGVKLFKLYAPAIGVGILSIGCMVTGHKILKGRNLALAAAYAAIDKGFKDYRKNVVDRFGEQLDKELRYNIKSKEFEIEEVDEKGETVVKKEVVDVVDPLAGVSQYARFFDDSCPDHQKDPEFNLMFLRKQQDWANDKLKAQGHLFLNEVYDMLGMPRSIAGQAVGWVYDEKNPVGDNYVDFGLYNVNREGNRNFINGYERNVLLDFNVDGAIYEILSRN